MGRHRLDPGTAIHVSGRAADDASTATAWLGRYDGRAGHDRLWLGRTEEAFPAADRQSRRLVVPGLFRTWRRFGPRLAAYLGETQRRPLCGQRTKDLDDTGAARRLDFLPGAHRSAGQEAR